MKRLLLALAFTGAAAPLYAQSPVSLQTIPPVAKTVSLAGPRYGITFLTDSLVRKLKTERDIEVKNTISQFGWQFEKQFYSKESGPTVLNEWVVLFGGLDQGVVLPSVNWMVGMRTKEGAEFGIGPNVTPAGVALAMAAGVTFRAGVLNIPMNFAVVPSKDGVRVSMLSGFTLRK
ncbi:MAG TPA: hypothetical protein VHN14_10310 [Kofleriaceae bacterium]|jgi:hypothetical protein|nr:hypothetical protein [Kofleriaceae bacterium]